MSDKPSKLKIADREFTSRLLVGTGKFASNELMRDALVASGTEIVTVALRRADLSGKRDPFANILDFIDPKRFLLLPNTSGARNADEAVRLARLAAAAGLPNWVKLEIHPDPRYLLPDPVETLAAAEILVKEGFTVLPYINADPVLAKRLQDVGTATVMPLGSPIGSNRGIETRAQIEIIIEQATVPVVVDAGLGAPSQAAEAMEMGADAVLVNTAIAIASDPSRMAHAFRKAVEAGREAREIGLAEGDSSASATSPLTGFLLGATRLVFNVGAAFVPRRVRVGTLRPLPHSKRLQRRDDRRRHYRTRSALRRRGERNASRVAVRSRAIRLRKRMDNVQLGGMGNEVFRLNREHSRDFLRSTARQLLLVHVRARDSGFHLHASGSWRRFQFAIQVSPSAHAAFSCRSWPARFWLFVGFV